MMRLPWDLKERLQENSEQKKVAQISHKIVFCI